MGKVRKLMRYVLAVLVCLLAPAAWAINAANYIPAFGGSTNFGFDGVATTTVPFRALMQDGGAPSTNYVQASLPRNVSVNVGSFYTPVYASNTVIQAGSRLYLVACRGNQNSAVTATLFDYDPATGAVVQIDIGSLTVSSSCGNGTQFSLSFSTYANYTLPAGHRLKISLTAKQTASTSADYVRIFDASASNNSVFTVVEGEGAAIGNCLAAGTYSSSWGVFRTLGSDGKPRVDFGSNEAVRYEFGSYQVFGTSSSTKNIFTATRASTSTLGDCTKTFTVSGTVYSYSTGASTSCYKGSYSNGYHQLVFKDIYDGVPYARSFINITPESDSLKFYSDAAYSMQTDTFKATDTVYAILTSPSLKLASVKSVTEYAFNGGGSTLAAKSTVAGTQIKLTFSPGTLLANGDWGAVQVIAYTSSKSTRTYVRNIRRLDSGCTYCAAVAPIDVVLQSRTASSITLAWTPDTAHNTAYRIYRNGVVIRDGVTGGTFTDTNLDQGTLYVYTVRGTSAGCESLDSNPVNAQTASNPGAFNARDFGIRADGTDPRLDNKIHTKLAGAGMSVELFATDAKFKDWAQVNAELWDASDSSGVYDPVTNCTSSYKKISTSPVVPTLDTGTGMWKASFPALANAYRNVTVKVNYSGSPTASGCSVDHFAMRPAAFKALEVTDGDWLTAGTGRSLLSSAGNNHRAGRPFRIKVEAQTAAGAVVKNYDGSPQLTLGSLLTPTGCASCAPGVISLGAWTNTAGVLETLNATYDEVGSFSLTVEDPGFAVVDQSDGSSLAEMTIAAASVNIGNFVPDAFILSSDGSPPTLAGTCSGGAFLGQTLNFQSLPVITASPVAYSGIPTSPFGAAINNLSGSLFRPLAVKATWTPAPGLGSLGASVAEDPANPGDYLLTLSGSLGFARPPLPQKDASTNPFCLPGDVACTGAPGKALALDVSVSDSYTEGKITGSLGATGSAPDFNLVRNLSITPSGPFGFGQLRLFSTFGTELLPLPVAPAKMAEIQTWFWNSATGGAFNSSNVSCSVLAPGQIAATYNKLTCADARLSMPAGLPSLNLSAPGVGKTGSVDLIWNLGATANGNTCTAGAPSAAATANVAGWLGGLNMTGTNYDANPTARARFGVRGTRRTLFLEAR